MRAARKALDELCDGRKRAPTIKQMAAFINKWLPHLEAHVSRTTVSTDRKYAGSRLRYPGAGRKGNIIEIYERPRKPLARPIHSHNAAETYRHNGELVRWVAEQIGHKEAWKLERRWVSW